jgi:hypothetical protein
VTNEQLDENSAVQSDESADQEAARLSAVFTVPKWEADKMRKRMSKRVARAREAITRLADHSAPQMVDWLQRAADGVPRRNFNGEPLRDGKGSVMWLVKPDPLGAFKAMADVMSYHMPRLKSVEATVQAQVEHTLDGSVDVKKLSTDDLKRLILRNAGIESLDAIEGELVEPLPDWLNPEPNASD